MYMSCIYATYAILINFLFLYSFSCASFSSCPACNARSASCTLSSIEDTLRNTRGPPSAALSIHSQPDDMALLNPTLALRTLFCSKDACVVMKN